MDKQTDSKTFSTISREEIISPYLHAADMVGNVEIFVVLLLVTVVTAETDDVTVVVIEDNDDIVDVLAVLFEELVVVTSNCS